MADQAANQRILAAVKRYTRRFPPDIVLYVDRVDSPPWDSGDLPLLRSIAAALGSSVWFNAIIALTHAASTPPEGPAGGPISYEVFVDQRSRAVQQGIRRVSGDMRLMNPVALVENHPSCRRNREGQRVLPNGISWRNQLLLLCYSSKILSEANSVLKLQEASPAKLFGVRLRSPPLPFFLSSLLQSRDHPKISMDSDVEELGGLSDSDEEDEEEGVDEYDQLPPFKPLRKAQIAKLTRAQRKSYFDEYDYRVKLLQRKQRKAELRRMKEMKRRGKTDQQEEDEEQDQDAAAPATIPVPLPDMVLPPSFDGDGPAYLYRFLEPSSELVVRPVLDSHGWDHDSGYDSVSVEDSLTVAGRFPATIAAQITKDKKDFNIHLDSSLCTRHGDGRHSTLAGVDLQTVGKQLAVILRGETRFRNLRRKNQTAAGMCLAVLGETVAVGMKVEDRLAVGKTMAIAGSGGAVRAQGETAYGLNVEVRLREAEDFGGGGAASLGLSLMRWRRDLAVGGNLQSQFSVGRRTKMVARIGMNNKLSGQITLRTSTSDELHQIGLLGLLPVALYLYRTVAGVGEPF
ncbi:unnamed protein product [Spirodela intermedia]|uniref:Translocase of chloroplast 159/132 membrane anchor domain-containing protein n=1 Tax=Spirodela intermedia TaxID=51605 RepID=A0A7I8JG22_SPIIN|nr:unnamed protein product [Spirodela intermedia]CAA6669096.1 unnamed protein product [Spirodela intermedia]